MVVFISCFLIFGLCTLITILFTFIYTGLPCTPKNCAALWVSTLTLSLITAGITTLFVLDNELEVQKKSVKGRTMTYDIRYVSKVTYDGNKVFIWKTYHDDEPVHEYDAMTPWLAARFANQLGDIESQTHLIANVRGGRLISLYRKE